MAVASKSALEGVAALRSGYCRGRFFCLHARARKKTAGWRVGGHPYRHRVRAIGIVRFLGWISELLKTNEHVASP